MAFGLILRRGVSGILAESAAAAISFKCANHLFSVKVLRLQTGLAIAAQTHDT